MLTVGYGLSTRTVTERSMAATAADPLDLAWGAKAIADEIGITARQAFHWLDSGKIKCAKKINQRWCADRAMLRAEFRAQLADA